MYIELFLKITVAVFAIFGLYAFLHLLWASLLRSDRIKTMLCVDSEEIAGRIDVYLEEAKNACSFFEKSDVIAVIMEKYANDPLLSRMRDMGIRYYVVKE